VGRGFTLLAYETGGFSGIPDGLPADYPLWQDTGFGFTSHLMVVRVIDEWEPSQEMLNAIKKNEQEYTETERAFAMEREADVVINYELPKDIRIRTAGRQLAIMTTHNELGAAIAGATDKREFVVIIMGKRVRLLSGARFRSEVDEIEKILRAQGFKRMVFQLAAAMGRPIYRE
jgi:hypothetical protein